MKEKKVTIIIPCYKVDKYITDCLECVIQQTYSELEIILVDDGSPDRCGEICEEYAKKDARIIVIHKTNGGLSDARNVAIDIASGDWITFIDSDDMVAPNYIERLVTIANDNGCKCSVVQPVSFIDGSSPAAKIVYPKVEVLNGMDAIAAMFYQTKLDTSAWNKLYHRSLFDSGIRYPKGYLFEDNPTTFRLLAECDKVAISNEQLYYYRVREGSIERQDFTPNKLDQGLEVIHMMETHPEITDKIKSAFRCKKASLALHFIMKMPLDYEKRQELWKYVTENRWSVIWDGKARLKTRVGCLISYLGIRVMKRIFAITK